MPDETNTFQHVTHLKKWDAEATSKAASFHGVDPDELTDRHFSEADLYPTEQIHIDHAAGTVHYEYATGTCGRKYTIDEWNAEVAG